MAHVSYGIPVRCRSLLTASMLAGGLLACTAASGQAPISIGAHIDGRDQLVLQGDSLRWHHFDFAAVGRHGGANALTVVQSQGWNLPWLPTWPAPPPNEIRFEAWSSTVTAPSVLVPRTDAHWRVTKYIGPGDVRVVSQPSATNDYRLVVQYDDNPIGGSTYYWIKLGTARQVVIDLRPSDRSNALNPNVDKVVQVAILGNLLPEGFDATTIDPATVRLGRGDAAPVGYTFKDVNGDGQQDVVASFRIAAAGITCGDAYVELTAQTIDGAAIEGRDVLRTGRCD